MRTLLIGVAALGQGGSGPARERRRTPARGRRAAYYTRIMALAQCSRVEDQKMNHEGTKDTKKSEESICMLASFRRSHPRSHPLFFVFFVFFVSSWFIL
jgi:hypothetical protein